MKFRTAAFPSPCCSFTCDFRHDLHCSDTRLTSRPRRSHAAARPCWSRRPAPSPAYAQGNVPVVRDAEIEALVRDYARPIFKAAGLSKSGIDIILVNDPRFNAFVAGRRMFINTGALLQAETPNEIIGVIAHEAGHIAGGHQERLRDRSRARRPWRSSPALLGVGAIAAGAATDHERTRPGRRRHRGGRRRGGRARPARLSALRGDDGRPLGASPISRRPASRPRAC